MKIFITGINGFLGRSLASHWLARGDGVRGSARHACDIPGVEKVGPMALGAPFPEGVFDDTVNNTVWTILWHSPTRTAAAYLPSASSPEGKNAAPRGITLQLDPKNAAAPFVDEETNSRWDITGRAVEGELKGWTLTWLDSVQVKWFAWAAEYPETSIYGK